MHRCSGVQFPNNFSISDVLGKFGKESDRSYVRIIGWDGQSPKWAKWSDRHNLWMNQRLLHGKCYWFIYLHAYSYLARRLKSEEKNNLRYQPRVRPKSACTELSSESSSENPRPHHTSQPEESLPHVMISQLLWNQSHSLEWGRVFILTVLRRDFFLFKIHLLWQH